MTPTNFRVSLARLGLSQAGFARLLQSLGHPARGIDRSVRRWAEIGGPGPPGEVIVILALLDRHGVPQLEDAA